MVINPSFHLFTNLVGTQGIDPMEALAIVESCEIVVDKLLSPWDNDEVELDEDDFEVLSGPDLR